MWDQFNSLAKAVSKQAADAVKDAGLDATLKNINAAAQSQLNTIANSVLEIEPGQKAGEALPSPSKPNANTTSNGSLPQGTAPEQNLLKPGSPSAPPVRAALGRSGRVPAKAAPVRATPAHDSETDDGFQDISLDDGHRHNSGTPSPLKRPLASNGAEAALLQDNTHLKKRLAAVEEAAAEAFGDLEDLKEQIAVEGASRRAVEKALRDKEVDTRDEISKLRSGWERDAARIAEKFQHDMEALQDEVKESLEAANKLEEVTAAKDATKAMETKGRRAAKAAKEYQLQLGELKQQHELVSAELEALRKEAAGGGGDMRGAQEAVLLAEAGVGAAGELQARLDEALAECERWRVQVAESEAGRRAEQEGEGQLQKVLAECEKLQEQVGEQLDQMGRQGMEAENVQRRCESLTLEVAELQEALAEAAAATAAQEKGVSSAAGAEAEKLQHRCESLTLEVAELQEALAAAQGKSVGNADGAETETLQRRCESLTLEVAELQEAMAAAQEKNVGGAADGWDAAPLGGEEAEGLQSRCESLTLEVTQLQEALAAATAAAQEKGVGSAADARDAALLRGDHTQEEGAMARLAIQHEELSSHEQKLRGLEAQLSAAVMSVEAAECKAVSAEINHLVDYTLALTPSSYSGSVASAVSIHSLQESVSLQESAVCIRGLQDQCQGLREEVESSRQLVVQLRGDCWRSSEAEQRMGLLTQQLLASLEAVESADLGSTAYEQLLELTTKLVHGGSTMMTSTVVNDGNDGNADGFTASPESTSNGAVRAATGAVGAVVWSAGLEEADAALHRANLLAEQLETQLAEQKGQVASLSAELQALQSERSHTNDGYSEVNAQLSEANAKLSAVSAELSEANAKLSAVSAELLEANTKLSDVSAELSKANAKLSAVSTKLLEADAEKESMRQKQEDLQLQLQALRSDNADAEGVASEHGRQLAELAALTAAHAASQRVVSELEASVSDLRRSVAELSSERDEALAQGEEARAQVEEEKNARSSEAKASTEKMSKMEDGRRAVIEKMTELQSTNAHYIKQISTLSEQLGSGSQETADLCDRLAKSEKELHAAQAHVSELQKAVTNQESQSAALREASQAELSLASSKLTDVQRQRGQATKRIKDVEQELEAAKEAVSAAEEESKKRCTRLAAEVSAARSELETAEAQLQVLRDSLTAERDASRAALTMAKAEFQAKLAEELASAGMSSQDVLCAKLEAVRSEAAAREAEARAENEALQNDLNAAKTEAIRLKSRGSDMDTLRAQVQAFGPMTTKMQEDLAKARGEATEAKEAQQKLEESVRKQEYEAAERTRKFSMLQRGFKNSEAALHEQLDLLTSQIDAHLATAAAAKVEAEEARSVAAAAQQELARLEEKLADVQFAMDRVEVELSEQAASYAECSGKLAASEAELQEERASRQAADRDDGALRHDFDRLVAAATVAKEEEAERRIAEAAEQLELAQDAVRDAEARADMAERAKIELTMALAQVDDDARATSSGTRSIDTHRQSGMSLGDDMQRHLDEAELAAAVQSRRAAKAEEELSTTSVQLLESEKQVKDLSWQIRMTSGSGSGEVTTIGGRKAAGAQGASGYLDFLGCGANYARKP